MPRITYTEGQLLGKNEVQHTYLKEAELSKGKKRQAKFKCGYCGTVFKGIIDAVKSGRKKSCGCTTHDRKRLLSGQVNSKKFETDESKLYLLQELRKHVGQGMSLNSFALCDKVTFQRIAKENRHIFTPEVMHELEASLHGFYERLGLTVMTGRFGVMEDVITNHPDGSQTIRKEFQPRPFNSSIWMFMAKNILGWQAEPPPLDDQNPGQGVTYELPEGTVLNPDGSIAEYQD